MTKNKPITDIFNDMDYEEKRNDDVPNHYDISMMYLKTYLFKYVNKSISITCHESGENEIQAAVKAHSGYEPGAPWTRTISLHHMWKDLINSQKFIKNQFIKLNKFSLDLEYFNYYSNLALLTEEHKNCTSSGVVFLALLNAPFFIVNAAVSAALAAGCLVILQTANQSAYVFLQNNAQEKGSNVVAKPIESKDLSEKVQKVVFFGNYTEAQDIYINSSSLAFSFLCPNNTAAMILESCDVSAAVEKIVSETWDPDSISMWAVSTVVVQESIYKTFLDKLKFQINQLEIEKKNHPQFKDQIICEKLKKITNEAIKAGAVVEECASDEGKWSPTVIVHYQDQDIEPDVPVLKILVCRTAKEGVALLNNSRYCLGTSIWTEISSQALQVASMLVCKNIWINCHGVTDPCVPIQPSGLSGNCVFGGHDGTGIIEFMSLQLNNTLTGKDINEENSALDKSTLLETVKNAHNTFNKWLLEKNKRKYLNDIAESLMDDKELGQLCETIIYNAHLEGVYSGECSPTSKEDFYVVQTKVPIGVIAIFINNSITDLKKIVSMITPAIGFGNAVVLVLKEKNSSLELLVKKFNAVLPKNLLNVIVGSTALIYLASDPNVEALWISNDHFSSEFHKVIKSHCAKTLKHIWIMPKIFPIPHLLLKRECLKNKVIWLSKIDQFP